MDQHRLVLALVLTLAAVACGKKSPPQPGEVVTFDSVCNAKSKRVTIDGYLESPTLVSCGLGSCGLSLNRTADLKPADATPTSRTASSTPPNFILVSFSIGDDPDEMPQPPERFTPADIKVRAHDGKTVGVGAKVRVTGELSCGAHDDDPSCAGSTSCSIRKADLVEAL